MEAPGVTPEVLYHKMNLLDAMSRASGLSFYVIDFHKRTLTYVSSGHLFLCGRTTEEVKEKGYHFYKEVMPEEDLLMLLDLARKGCELFYTLSTEARKRFIISYDFRIKLPGGPTLMVNQKLSTILLNEKGEMWMALCVLNLSPSEEPGNMYVKMDDELHHLHYSPRVRRWQKNQVIRLTSREREILLLSASGYSREETGKKLFIAADTVNYHKKGLYEKLGVTTITEAIAFANNHWLL